MRPPIIGPRKRFATSIKALMQKTVRLYISFITQILRSANTAERICGRVSFVSKSRRAVSVGSPGSCSDQI